ncbi:hypothetical protein F4604DRAFT_1677219 [Suillus subluteus]|nr:hypothetical protein F4604DRAFT_1677219 [Suillus subluteus]
MLSPACTPSYWYTSIHNFQICTGIFAPLLPHTCGASEDTGMPVLFKNIHGRGWFGMFCMNLRSNETPCIYEPHRQLRQINAYDLLRRFYGLLSASEAQPDLQRTFDIINQGGSIPEDIWRACPLSYHGPQRATSWLTAISTVTA